LTNRSHYYIVVIMAVENGTNVENTEKNVVFAESMARVMRGAES